MRFTSTSKTRSSALADDWYKELLAQNARLQFAVSKLSKWSGIEVSDLYEDGYLNEGDMG